MLIINKRKKNKNCCFQRNIEINMLIYKESLENI